MVNPASATGWEVRAASSPGHSWRSMTQADAQQGCCAALVFRPQLLQVVSSELRGEGCVWPMSAVPAGRGTALAPKQQAPHHSETVVAQQALPVGPVPQPPSWEGVGNGELPPQAGGQWGEAEGLLFPFLPLLLHPKHSCSISCHLGGVGPPHTHTCHPGEAPPWRPVDAQAQ